MLEQRQIHLIFPHAVHNPYDEQIYLCVAMSKSVLLMQWYEPLTRFMKVKVILKGGVTYLGMLTHKR